jgi:hypothetical protein
MRTTTHVLVLLSSAAVQCCIVVQCSAVQCSAAAFFYMRLKQFFSKQALLKCINF